LRSDCAAIASRFRSDCAAIDPLLLLSSLLPLLCYRYWCHFSRSYPISIPPYSPSIIHIHVLFSPQTLVSTLTARGAINFDRNPSLKDLTPLGIMDEIIRYCGQPGVQMRVILDHHKLAFSNVYNDMW
jgi:hypothetical protein